MEEKLASKLKLKYFEASLLPERWSHGNVEYEKDLTVQDPQ